MRNALIEAMLESAKKQSNIFLIAADISPAGSIQIFEKNYPNQFINVGVAESSMIGLAAGLALRDAKVIVYTIAPFAFYRPFEFIRNDIILQKLPVLIIGMGAGLVYSNLGLTHQSIEDIAIAKSLPNLNVIAPCDPEEVSTLVKHHLENATQPTYLRLGKSGEKVVANTDSESIEFGKLRLLRKGNKIAVLTYGVLAQIVSEVIDVINIKNNLVALFSSHTIKPFDYYKLDLILQSYNKILIIEETVNNGSLGMEIINYVYKSGKKNQIEVMNLGDVYIENYGSYEDLLEQYGIGRNEIKVKIQEMLL